MAVLLLGSLARAVYVNRPFDYRMRTSWRQSDYIQIARNYYRDGHNIFFPRVDWAGQSPGYVEAELPILPWLGSILFRAFGYSEVMLRMISAAASIIALFLFAAIARRILNPEGALAATGFFAFNPLLSYLSTAIQPESLMILASLGAVYAMMRWEASPTWGRLAGASFLVGTAILIKTPAASVGLVLAFLVLSRYGASSFVRPGIYVAALLGLLLPIAWYVWAKYLWLEYGNSLGISNETHFVGMDVLFPPTFLKGNLKWETLGVFSPVGWLLAACAFLGPRRFWKLGAVWYGAACFFYILAARTSGDEWAYYYHCNSVPAACLLMGAGFQNLREQGGQGRTPQRLAALAILGATIMGLSTVMGYLMYLRDNNPRLENMYRCAQAFTSYVPRDSMIIVPGGRMFDELGHPVAYNEPMVFAWMDRKGFNYGVEEFSLETIDELAAKGGEFWFAPRLILKTSGLEEEFEKRYERVASCSQHGFDLYKVSERLDLKQVGEKSE